MSTGGALVMLIGAAILLFVFVLYHVEKRKMAAYKAKKARLQTEATANRP
ncbi:hypothetical protein [Sphingomonas sp.]|jgi:hypothetical protein